MYLDICAKCSNNRFHKICVLDELFCDSMIPDRIRQDIFHKCARKQTGPIKTNAQAKNCREAEMWEFEKQEWRKEMKKFLALFVAVVMLLSVSACGQPAEETTAPPESEAPAQTGGTAETTFGIEPLPEKTTIDLAYFSGAEHGLVFYIMDEMGWAEELNIEFNWQYFSAGPAMMEASGSWDVGTAGCDQRHRRLRRQRHWYFAI